MLGEKRATATMYSPAGTSFQKFKMEIASNWFGVFAAGRKTDYIFTLTINGYFMVILLIGTWRIEAIGYIMLDTALYYRRPSLPPDVTESNERASITLDSHLTFTSRAFRGNFFCFYCQSDLISKGRLASTVN